MTQSKLRPGVFLSIHEPVCLFDERAELHLFRKADADNNENVLMLEFLLSSLILHLTLYQVP